LTQNKKNKKKHFLKNSSIVLFSLSLTFPHLCFFIKKKKKILTNSKIVEICVFAYFSLVIAGKKKIKKNKLFYDFFFKIQKSKKKYFLKNIF
jgi:hypothetical protein